MLNDLILENLKECERAVFIMIGQYWVDANADGVLIPRGMTSPLFITSVLT